MTGDPWTGPVSWRKPALFGLSFGVTGLALAAVHVAGQLKVPHAVALHAVQALPLLAWLLTATPLTERARVRLVAVAAVGYAGLVAVSGRQAFRGLAPWRLDVAADVVAATSLVLLVAAAGVCGWSLVRAATGSTDRWPGEALRLSSATGRRTDAPRR